MLQKIIHGSSTGVTSCILVIYKSTHVLMLLIPDYLFLITTYRFPITDS